jgi:DnaJ-class molecular chaperone
MSGDARETTANIPPPHLPADLPDDGPASGEWVECWECGGDGKVEGDDPFWDWGDWNRCDTCRGQGGWFFKDAEASDAG